MKPLLEAELIKLRTTRTFLALAGVAIGLSALITVLTALLSTPTKESVLVDVFASDMSSLFIMILAIVGISGEWRHRTITSSLLAAPDRLRFMAAKTLAFAAAGLLLSLLISIVVAILGFVLLSIRDLPVPDLDEVLTLTGRNMIIAALAGAFGVGIGALVRNQPTAIVSVLVISFAIEPAVIGLASEVGRYGPFVALPIAIQGIPAADIGFGELDLLSPWLAGLAMLGWIAVVFALATFLLRRRDVE